MGEKLSALFARAQAEGGVVASAKLALKLNYTSVEAAGRPDTPVDVQAATAALAELLRSQVGKPPATTDAKPAVTPGAPGRLLRYFELAQEHGGLTAVVKLAGKTGITRQTAGSTPETPEVLAKVHAALAALFPEVSIPRL
jgi:hypothetical protein